MEFRGVVELVVLTIAALAVFFPKSPFAIILFKNRGPRTDYDNLLSHELRYNARQFLSVAFLVWFVLALLVYVPNIIKFKDDDVLLAYYVVIGIIALFSSYFVINALSSYLRSLLRRKSHEDLLIMRRLSVIMPDDIKNDQDRIMKWFRETNPIIPGCPDESESDLKSDDGGGPKIKFLAMGIMFVVMGAFGIYDNFIIDNGMNQPFSPGLLVMMIAMFFLGAFLIVTAVRMDKNEKAEAKEKCEN